MSTETNKKRHPEDVIYDTKKFINELQKVQEYYFEKLTNELNLNNEGKDFLFDYVYNESIDDYDGFDHYLDSFKKDNKNMINGIDVGSNGLDNVSVLDNKPHTKMDYMFNGKCESFEPIGCCVPDDFGESSTLICTNFDETIKIDDNSFFKIEI